MTNSLLPRGHSDVFLFPALLIQLASAQLSPFTPIVGVLFFLAHSPFDRFEQGRL